MQWKEKMVNVGKWQLWESSNCVRNMSKQWQYFVVTITAVTVTTTMGNLLIRDSQKT